MAKNVVKKEQNPLALDERPDWIDDSSIRGSEDVGIDDIVIPRIDVIQDLSPQIKKNKPEYIEGAEPGVLFNTVTGELYGNSITIVPVYFRKEWVVWKDRTSGGGFRGAFSSPDEAEAHIKGQDDASSLEAIDTAQHFVLVVTPDGKPEQAVISMSRSKMKTSRKLNSIAKMLGGDRFSRVYTITATEESGAKGEYWGLGVKAIGYSPKHLYDAGLELYNAIKDGSRGIDYSDVTGDKGVESEEF